MEVQGGDKMEVDVTVLFDDKQCHCVGYKSAVNQSVMRVFPLQCASDCILLQATQTVCAD